MVQMALGTLFFALLARHVTSVTVISSSTSGAAARAAEWRAVSTVDVEARRFWAAQWSGLEADLEKLRAAAAAVAAAAPAPEQKVHRKSPLAGLKLNLNPKNTQDLVPALGMLKGLYEDGKARIGQLNAREKDLKGKYDLKKAEHDRRLQAIEARFKNHTLSAEWRANETRDENRLWNYWERVRERQHKQYHTSLKIQHGTLEKVKTMIDMYEKTISGKADKAKFAKQLKKVGGGSLPDIVFLQDAQTATIRSATMP
uniref:Uncharacterized protein n=1 Tax=Pfiesteria piscicida TaxID=71001 RepID=A3E3M7_PFIPI|nr:unknown [Pfiesteria piscicida]